MTEEIKKALYKWFEMKYQTYDKLEYGDSIYLYYDGEEFADIRIYKKHETIAYNLSIYEEFYLIIPIDQYVFEGVISNWVEDAFNLMGFTTVWTEKYNPAALKIPK